MIRKLLKKKATVWPTKKLKAQMKKVERYRFKSELYEEKHENLMEQIRMHCPHTDQVDYKLDKLNTKRCVFCGKLGSPL